jgi:hypothetical protein
MSPGYRDLTSRERVRCRPLLGFSGPRPADKDEGMRDSFEVESVRRHLLFILTGDVAHRLQALRVRWDPVMARANLATSLLTSTTVSDGSVLIVSVVSVSPTMRTWGCFVSRWSELDHPCAQLPRGIHLDGPQHDRGKSILDW